MARIRAIKPEFWSSPNLPADPWTRLLFIALWNWADDAGVGTANLRELAGFAFPNDNHIRVDCGTHSTGTAHCADTAPCVRRMCADIAAHFGAQFYTVDGRPYFAIPSWNEHQKMDRRRTGRYPGPDQAETWLYQEEHEKTAQCADTAPTSPRAASAGTGEQGNRGTGEQGSPPALPEVPHQSSRTVSRRGGETRAAKRIADLNATARSGAADKFATEFNRWAGGGIPSQMCIEIAQEVDQLIADGIDAHQIAEGVKAWHRSDRVYASQIPHFVAKAAKTTEPASRATKATLRAVDTIAATEALIAEFHQETA